MTKRKKLSPEGYTRLKDAIYHMAHCWDALSDVENELGILLEEKNIYSITGGIGAPEEAYQISKRDLDRMIREARS